MSDNEPKKPFAIIENADELDAILNAIHDAAWNEDVEQPAVDFLLRYWPDVAIPDRYRQGPKMPNRPL